MAGLLRDAFEKASRVRAEMAVLEDQADAVMEEEMRGCSRHADDGSESPSRLRKPLARPANLSQGGWTKRAHGVDDRRRELEEQRLKVSDMRGHGLSSFRS